MRPNLMKKISIIFLSLVVLLTNIVFANSIDLHQKRVAIINKYINYLGDGKFQYIPLLFSKSANVIPKSGQPDSPNHFYTNVLASTHAETKTTLLNIFKNEINENMYMVYFNFKWETPDAKFHSENFLDLILFDRKRFIIKKLIVLGPEKFF
jgi:hypothetical protein